MARRWVRRSVFVVSAVLAGVMVSSAVYGLSVEPGAAIVKAVFEAKPEVTPPAGFDAIEASVVDSAAVSISAAGIPAAELNIYGPIAPHPHPLPVIVWIHGGGFVSSSADTVKDYVTILASHGYIVANIDYSLAPGARHPVPVLQANAALAYLNDHVSDYGGDPSQIFIGGDSAGAQIASELVSVQTNSQLATSLGTVAALSPSQLKGAILFCGLYDMRTVAATGFPALRTYLWAYTGNRTWTDYAGIDDLSATETATSAYPATFLSVGDADPLQPQAIELAAALRARGVSVTTLMWAGTGDGLGHEYQFDFTLPQAQTALQSTLEFIASKETSK